MLSLHFVKIDRMTESFYISLPTFSISAWEGFDVPVGQSHDLEYFSAIQLLSC
jgi:hypothetical protein